MATFFFLRWVLPGVAASVVLNAVAIVVLQQLFYCAVSCGKTMTCV